MKKDYITFEEHIKQKHTEKIIANMLQDHCSIAKIEQWTKLPQDRIIEITKANNIPLQ